MGRSNFSFFQKKNYYEKIKKLKNYIRNFFVSYINNIRYKCGYFVKTLQIIYEKYKTIYITPNETMVKNLKNKSLF